MSKSAQHLPKGDHIPTFEVAPGERMYSPCELHKAAVEETDALAYACT
jgi:hypothetical protein